MGHEREGLSARVRAECDAMVAIRGSGAVESLNVSIAGSILLFALSGAR
jgi:tRNA G18 (ribose-2'-O)-methylase SpoU